MTDGADLLAFQLTAVGLTDWKREHVFHPTRKWRLDLSFPGQLLGVEVEGFASGGKAGRHQRIGGFTSDCEKYAELAIMGWRLIRCTTRQVKSGEALQWIERALHLTEAA